MSDLIQNAPCSAKDRGTAVCVVLVLIKVAIRLLKTSML